MERGPFGSIKFIYIPILEYTENFIFRLKFGFNIAAGLQDVPELLLAEDPLRPHAAPGHLQQVGKSHVLVNSARTNCSRCARLGKHCVFRPARRRDNSAKRDSYAIVNPKKYIHALTRLDAYRRLSSS
jgi:hypothetical protein